jgi:predicted AlkP superfamily pyrophosphatase or phosphodiesterase
MHKGPYIDWSRGKTGVTPYKNLSHALKKIDRYIKRLRSPSYTYVYMPEVDTLSHEFGSSSPEVLQAVEESDRFLSDLRSGLPDSVRIAVTADHGSIDVDRDHYFTLHHDDPMHEYLEFPPTAESRNPIFHVKAEKIRGFRRYFNGREFGDHFLLITPDEAEKMKLYGPELLTKKCRSRLGSFIAVAESPAAIEYVPKDREAKKHKGFHGGLHPDEMRIPFFES